MKILSINNIKKAFVSGDSSLEILKGISQDFEQGKTYAIVGPSGSGKSTLLAICAGLDIPTEGTVELCGERFNTLSENQRAKQRNLKVGFVFQNFQLLPTLTALENVMVPLELLGKKDAKEKAVRLLERVGLGSRMSHFPNQLSGGEQQRVAIARAFANEPEILFADEPTGNLDEETGEMIENLLFEINKEKGTTLVIVTHDKRLAQLTNSILQMEQGKLVLEQKENILS